MTAVSGELLKKRTRTFTVTETAFFQKWFDENNDVFKILARNYINSGTAYEPQRVQVDAYSGGFFQKNKISETTFQKVKEPLKAVTVSREDGTSCAGPNRNEVTNPQYGTFQGGGIYQSLAELIIQKRANRIIGT